VGRDEQQTQAVADAVAAVLGDAVVGVYLYGSAVLGGLRPDSDIDLLVVARRTLEHAERLALLSALLDLSGRRARRVPGRPVELTVVVEGSLRPWSYPAQEDFQYGEWLRDAYETGAVPAPRANPDLAVLITLASQGHVVLQGPSASHLLPVVPAADLVTASTAGVPDLLDEVESDTRNVLLTLARVWLTVATGAVRPKDEAARWAIPRLPATHRPPLVLARDAYLGQAANEDWQEQWSRLVPLCAFITQRIAGEADAR
jgi:predicted nucleotidyltransferase